MRTARKPSESHLYHIVSRGVGQQIIFEGDSDRLRYMERLGELLREADAFLPAWCLMDNHVHLLVDIPFEKLSGAMRRLNSGYALYFNLVHGRSGHLFQGRFLSEPVETDEYLIAVVRYIHQNPIKAGLSEDCSYEWSSFDRYLEGNAPEGGERIIEIFGGMDAFKAAHEKPAREKCLDVAPRRIRLSDSDAQAVAAALFGDAGLPDVKALPRTQRDRALALLKEEGLTARQIQRLTGVSLGVISQAKLT